VTVERIAEPALTALVEREVWRARAAGRCYIRDAEGFRAHLVEVAQRAERIARRLVDVLPPEESPDPVVAFVAGAWHDGGKIWNGDDFHEIASAIELIDHGVEWGIVRGPAGAAGPVLARAARAILPHFAIFEQWEPTYLPTRGHRAAMEPLYRRLTETLGWSAVAEDRQRTLLLPVSVEALVVMYSDMAAADDGCDEAVGFVRRFERRWLELETRAAADDPGLLAVLPGARLRIHMGCALIDRFLTQGYDADALRRFRAACHHSSLRSAWCHDRRS
jgi:hypothetical protein